VSIFAGMAAPIAEWRAGGYISKPGDVVFQSPEA